MFVGHCPPAPILAMGVELPPYEESVRTSETEAKDINRTAKRLRSLRKELHQLNIKIETLNGMLECYAHPQTESWVNDKELQLHKLFYDKHEIMLQIGIINLHHLIRKNIYRQLKSQYSRHIRRHRRRNCCKKGQQGRGRCPNCGQPAPSSVNSLAPVASQGSG